MSSIFEQTSMLSSARSVPKRVLVVDDDAALLGQVATLLTNHGLDVARAANGEEALTLLAREWIPLLITDDEMPVMDGIELTHRVRALAAKPTYIIMLTSMSKSADLERGYCAGVDHYVSKKNWESALGQRAADGLTAIRLRRGGKRKLANDSVVTVDLQSSAHTARHLVGRLNAEIMLAQRRNSNVTVATLGVSAPANARAGQSGLGDDQLSAVLGAIKGAIRPQLDWVAWLHPVASTHRFLIVLPDLGSEAAKFEKSIRNAFVSWDAQSGLQPQMTFGLSMFQAGGDVAPAALELVGKAESARRSAQASSLAGVEAVQPGN